MHSRRQFLAGTAGLSLAALLTRTLRALSPYPSPIGRGEFVSQEKKGTRIILLGTKGGPRVGEAVAAIPRH